ncbi:MAG: hypothetical protein J1E02_00230 [Coprobacter sp.]|nr:hypothetical protein [Coprobacter sp.]
MKTIRFSHIALFFFLAVVPFHRLSAQSRTARPLFNAEDSVRRVQPATMMQRDSELLQKALEINDTPQVIRHLIGRMDSQLYISQDSFPAQLARIEKFTRTVSQSAEKALLNSLLAELYLNAYIDDAYIYEKRSRQPDAPADIREWDAGLFTRKIDSLLVQSLLPAGTLQQTLVETFRAVITFGDDSRQLRPTLFDFLAGRAIDIYRALPFSGFSPASPSRLRSALAPAQEFMQEAASGCETPDCRILDIYRQLLRFHGNDPLSPAFLVTDLDRLAFAAARVPDGSARYTEALLQQLERYATSPESVEIAARLLVGYMYNESDSLLRERITGLLADSKKRLEMWPQAVRSADLRKAVEAIEQPFLSVQAPAVIYPDGKDSLRVTWRNLDDIRLQIYRIPAGKAEPARYEPVATYPAGQPVYEAGRHLSDTCTPIERQTRIPLPALAPGRYMVKARSLSSPADSACTAVHVTRLMSAFSRVGEKQTIFVADARSGKPLSKASVQLYSYQRNDSLEYLGDYRTDKNGTVDIDTPETLRYRIVLRNDTCPLSFRSYPEEEYTPEEVHLALFTDRSLYRPGQTVQFTGICYRLGKESRQVLPGETVSLSLSRWGEPLSAREVTTDGFGAFSGEFTLPDNITSGWMSIDARTARTSSAISFEIAEYKRPTFRIDFRETPETAGFGQTASVKGQVSRYSGTPLSGARTEYRILRLPDWFRRGAASRQQVAEGTLLTDEKGGFTIQFTPQKPEEDAFSTGFGYNYRIEVTVTAPNGETQETAYTLPVSDSPVSVSVSLPDLIDRTRPVPLGIQVTDSRPSGTPVECRYILYSLYPSETPQEIYQLHQNKIHSQITQQEFTAATIPDSARWEQLPSGAYRLLVQAVDPQGKIISSQADFVLYSPRDKKLPVHVTEWIPCEKYTVRPGETAHIVYGTSFEDTYLLVRLYEGTRLLETRRMKISNRVKTIDIPYKESYRDDLTLSLLFIKEGQVYSRQIAIEREQPSPLLQITAGTFRDRMTPGEREEWTFTVKDASGQPVSARFVSEMFDASLNDLRPHDWHFAPALFTGRPIHWQAGADTFGFRTAKYHAYPYIPAAGIYCYDLLKVPFSVLYRDSGTGHILPQPRLYGTAAGGIQMNSMLRMKSSVTADAVMEESIAETADAGEAPAPMPAAYRQNFSETAFFYPRLQTDDNGEVSVRFTVPDSNTRWQFLALAFTRQLQYRVEKRTAVSSKTLMVSPNVPRFVRQGDRTTLAASVENSGDSLQEGTLRFELFDPATDTVLQQDAQAFVLGPGESKTVIFPFTAPEESDLAGVRVQAVTACCSDGEQHWLPVLPEKIQVTEALRFSLNEGETEKKVEMRAFTDTPSRTRQNYRMTLEYSANPIWYAVQALPALTEITENDATRIFAAYYTNTLAAGIARAHPQIASALRQWNEGNPAAETLRSRLEKNPELKSVLLAETAWVLEARNQTEQMRQLARLFDTNRTEALQDEALKKLQQLQNSDGGWSWTPQSPANPFITLRILYGLKRLTDGGWSNTDNRIARMQLRALAYADRIAATTPRNLNSQLYYLFVRSHYRDIPLTGETLAAHREMTAALRKEWPKLALYEKALSAVILYRYGFPDDARQVIRSLREQATVTAENGMFWQNNRSYRSSRTNAIQVHTALMTAFAEVTPDTTELDRMKVWLLQQKLTQNWGSVPSTVDAIDILLRTGTSWITDNGTLHLRWGNEELPVTPDDRITGYVRYTRQGKEIDSESGKVTVRRDSRQPASGALYWQYFDSPLHIGKSEVPGLSVEKQLRVGKTTPDGIEYVPVNTTTLHTGDLVEVRLIVKTGQDLDFVCLTDQRAACFEPVEQLSQYKWSEKTSYLQENGDAATRFFFESLPKGTYLFTYPVRIDRSGTYGNGITTLQCQYAPQFVAHTAGGVITVE